ncbi:hypothetical protein [Enterovibrio norvegicus]|uniref:Mobile element protein n=1 Tax=Enterovibrio norvegicus TaxID=188144 RepID=A0ABV4L389_9GAMM|nr:hypothetical protein [Enterovibrio norvegicus]
MNVIIGMIDDATGSHQNSRRGAGPIKRANKALLDKKRIGTQKQTLLELASGFLDVVANQRASLVVEKRFAA